MMSWSSMQEITCTDPPQRAQTEKANGGEHYKKTTGNKTEPVVSCGNGLEPQDDNPKTPLKIAVPSFWAVCILRATPSGRV